MEELRIKCPSCGIILDVRNSKNEDVKRIVCPSCKRHLAITFHEQPVPASHTTAVLCFGKAMYQLKEGKQMIGRKDPQSKAEIQIATGDASLLLEHAHLKVVARNDGSNMYIVSPCSHEATLFVNQLPLEEGDEVMLNIGDELRLGDTVLRLTIPTINQSI